MTIQNVISDFVTSRDVTYQGMIFQNVIYPSVTSQSTTNSSVKSHFVISRSVTSTGVTIKNVTFSVTNHRKSFKKGMATLHFRLSIIDVKLELNSNKHDPETKKYFVCIICKMSSLENDNDACLLFQQWQKSGMCIGMLSANDLLPDFFLSHPLDFHSMLIYETFEIFVQPI